MSFNLKDKNAQSQNQKEERVERPTKRKENNEKREQRKAVKRDRGFDPQGGDYGRGAKFVERAKEVIRNSDDHDIVQIDIPGVLSAASSTLSNAAVITNVNDELYVHLFLFETKSEPLEVVQDKTYPRSEEVYQYTATLDFLTEETIAGVIEWVETNYGKTTTYSGTMVVGSEADLEDDSVIKTLGHNATDTNYLVSGDEEPFDYTSLGDNKRLKARVEHSSLNTQDYLGLPKRSDFQIDVLSVDRSKTERNPLAGDVGEECVVSVDGYADAYWVGHSDDLARDSEALQQFMPEVVLGNIDTAVMPNVGGNFERTNLGIVAAMYLADDNLWAKGFEGNIHDDVNISSFAFGMDWEFNDDHIDEGFKQADENPEMRHKVLKSIFVHDGGTYDVMFSVLVKEGSLNYSTTQLLLDVANGDEDSIEIFRSSLHDMTNGEFNDDAYVIESASDVFTGQVRLPYGYYVSADGKKPLEDITLLKVLDTIKNSDYDMIRDYIEATAITDQMLDENEAITKLVNIYNHVTGGNTVIKGFTTKLTFNPDFLQALAATVRSKNSKLGMYLDTNVSGGSLNNRRMQSRRGKFGISGSGLRGTRRGMGGGRGRSGRNRITRDLSRLR